MLENYKSWSDIRNRLENDLLCNSLKNRVQYFYTAYHEVRNCYCRASVRIDGKELVHFTWNKGHEVEYEISTYLVDNNLGYYEKAYKIEEHLKPSWDERCLYDNGDFLDAIQKFFHLKIVDALKSDNLIVRLFAILDRRVGKRTLKRMKENDVIENIPDWLKQFYLLRFKVEDIH